MEVIIKRVNPDELYHHGVKGMKWGVRRYQNADGSLTEAGKKRIDRRMKRPHNFYNEARVIDKVNTAVLADSEYRKAIERRHKAFDDTQKAKESLYDAERSRKEPKEIEKISNKIDRSYKKIFDIDKEITDIDRKIASKFMQEYESALLKDIRVEDTEAGRAYIREKYSGTRFII